MFQLVSVIAIALLTLLDRLSKMAVVAAFKGGNTKDFLFGLFKFRYVENTGAAFSIFADNTLALSIFTVLVIILCLCILLGKKTSSRFASVCLILIIAGGIGNEIDRIAYGYVVDFIDPQFMKFAVFNVADCFITVGAILLMCYEFYLLFKEKKEQKINKETEPENND